MVILKCDILIPKFGFFIKAGTQIFVDRKTNIGYAGEIHFDIGFDEYDIIH